MVHTLRSDLTIVVFISGMSILITFESTRINVKNQKCLNTAVILMLWSAIATNCLHIKVNYFKRPYIYFWRPKPPSRFGWIVLECRWALTLGDDGIISHLDVKQVFEEWKISIPEGNWMLMGVMLLYVEILCCSLAVLCIVVFVVLCFQSM